MNVVCWHLANAQRCEREHKQGAADDVDESRTPAVRLLQDQNQQQECAAVVHRAVCCHRSDVIVSGVFCATNV